MADDLPGLDPVLRERLRSALAAAPLAAPRPGDARYRRALTGPAGGHRRVPSLTLAAGLSALVIVGVAAVTPPATLAARAAGGVRALELTVAPPASRAPREEPSAAPAPAAAPPVNAVVPVIGPAPVQAPAPVPAPGSADGGRAARVAPPAADGHDGEEHDRSGREAFTPPRPAPAPTATATVASPTPAASPSPRPSATPDR